MIMAYNYRNIIILWIKPKYNTTANDLITLY